MFLLLALSCWNLSDEESLYFCTFSKQSQLGITFLIRGSHRQSVQQEKANVMGTIHAIQSVKSLRDFLGLAIQLRVPLASLPELFK